MTGPYIPPMRLLLAASMLLCAAASSSRAAVLTLQFGHGKTAYTTGDLLARPDKRQIALQDFGDYPASRVEAVPLRDLLQEQDRPAGDMLRMQATDGFSSDVPLSLVMRPPAKVTRAWLAIELPGKPWPRSQGQDRGPFALVWTDGRPSGVAREQWVDRLFAVTPVASPIARWPQLAASPHASASARQGQALFMANCMPCHQLAGAGNGTKGPDLDRPMNAAAYLSKAGFHALIRDPGAVRRWPAQQMEGFPPSLLSDRDIDAIIAYVGAIGGQTRPRGASLAIK